MLIDLSNIHPTMVLALSPFIRTSRDDTYAHIEMAHEAADTIVDMEERDRDRALDRGMDDETT